MLPKYFLPLALIMNFVFCETDSEKQRLNRDDPEGLYGNKISDGDIYSVDELLQSPKNFLNKNIKITGNISEVCPMRGCWIEIVSDDLKSSIRIKVTDGEIVFPLSSVGRDIIAQGDFEKLILSKKQAKMWKMHLAAEKGISLDTADIKLKEDDFFEYRLYSDAAKIF
tara:strand:+ start:254 stop:757 length:504 start_codon:yes stop_codon:yes gene_type:complete